MLEEKVFNHGEPLVVELELKVSRHLHVGSYFLEEDHVIIKIGELLRCVEYQESFKDEFCKVLLGGLFNGLQS